MIIIYYHSQICSKTLLILLHHPRQTNSQHNIIPSSQVNPLRLSLHHHVPALCRGIFGSLAAGSWLESTISAQAFRGPRCAMMVAMTMVEDVLKKGRRWAEDVECQIRRPGSACTVFFCYVASKILSQGAHPKSPVQNPKSKSKIPKFQNPNFAHKDLLHNVPKIQNPKSPKSRKSKIQNPQNPKSKLFWPDFGDFEFWIPAPKSKIQTPQNPKSKIPKIQNPKSPKSSAEIQNLGRWGPHVKNCFLMMQNPKSKIPKIRPKKLGFWILGILDCGDFGFWDFGDFGFWIVGILDFGFWDFGFWGFWILGILGILDFGIWGRSRGCTTRQFGDGAWRPEARIPPGLPFRGHFKTNCI